jgi:uncharacterized phiE125 gp8 family phage protein
MGYSLVTAATTMPISVEEAKLHLRVTEDDEDTLILGLIKAATDFAQSWTKRQFITATYDLFLDSFPASDWCFGTEGWAWKRSEIVVPKPPLQTVTYLKYYDLDGVQQTLAPATYEVDLSVDPACIRLAYNQSWPSVQSRANAIVVRFVCGYGLAPSVPDTIKAAIKLHVGHLYENREAVNIGNITSELDFTLKSLLDMEKVPVNI